MTVDSKRNIALYIERIVMLKGEGNYTLFHLQDGKTRMYAHDEDRLIIENNLVANA